MRGKSSTMIYSYWTLVVWISLPIWWHSPTLSCMRCLMKYISGFVLPPWKLPFKEGSPKCLGAYDISSEFWLGIIVVITDYIYALIKQILCNWACSSTALLFVSLLLNKRLVSMLAFERDKLCQSLLLNLQFNLLSRPRSRAHYPFSSYISCSVIFW